MKMDLIVYNSSQRLFLSGNLFSMHCNVFRLWQFCCHQHIPSRSLTVLLSHHHMGPTDRVNENSKQEFPTWCRSPALLFMCTRNPAFHIQIEKRRRNSATCCHQNDSEESEAGGRNILSAAEQSHISWTHCSFPHICISLKNVNY